MLKVASVFFWKRVPVKRCAHVRPGLPRAEMPPQSKSGKVKVSRGSQSNKNPYRFVKMPKSQFMGNVHNQGGFQMFFSSVSLWIFGEFVSTEANRKPHT